MGVVRRVVRAVRARWARRDPWRALILPVLADPPWSRPERIDAAWARLMTANPSPARLRALPIRTRLAAHALLTGGPEGLAALDLALRDAGPHLPTALHVDGTVTLQLALPTEPDEALCTLTEADLAPQHLITRRDETAIEGWAFIRHIDLTDTPTTIRVYHRTRNGDETDLAVATRTEQVSRWVRSKYPNYDVSAFRATGPRPPDAELRISVTTAGRTRDFAATAIQRSGAAAHPDPAPAPGPAIREVTVTASGLHLDVTAPSFPGGRPPAATLSLGTLTLAPTSDNGPIPLVRDVFGESHPVPHGTYRANLPAAPQLLARLPLELVSDAVRVRLTTDADRTLFARLNPPLADDEVGAHQQARLQRHHAATTPTRLPDTVLFHSYTGDQPSDSGLAIHRELARTRPDLTLCWAVSNPAVPLPDGAEPVLVDSERWYETLCGADYLVNNVFFPTWWRKTAHQTYVQTWHGTPLKRIGIPYWRGKGHNPAWIDRYLAQIAGIDFFLSNSAYLTERIRADFAYGGTVLESGLPRNDLLKIHDVSLRGRVAHRVGADPDRPLVLYAPTWRDRLSARTWQADFYDGLDVPALAAELGGDATLLIRGHGHHARAGAAAPIGGDVIDVTYYPDVAELAVAADLLVTDYSSLMFDFAVTGKPMVFFAPDLDLYAGERGLYLDYEQTVPGPVLRTQQRLAGTIRDALADPAPTAGYREFQRRFTTFDDGDATGRVVRAVFGGGD